MTEVGCLKDGHFNNLQVEGVMHNTSLDGTSTPALRQVGAPLSGVFGSGSHAGIAAPGAICLDKLNNVLYRNEGTKASPYWSPEHLRTSIGLRGVAAQLNGGEGGGTTERGIGVTTASTIVGHHVRVYGEGIAETDSGIASAGASGASTSNLTTTNEDVHTIALSMGESGHTLTPATHGPIVIDIDYTNNALDNRSIFLGFQDLSIDALIEPCIGATATITFNNVSSTCDNIAGMFLDTALTRTTNYFLVHTKADAAATFATSASFGGATNGVGVVADAATFQRLRMQVSAAGNITAFINKVEVGTVVGAMKVDEPIVPLFCLGAGDANVAQANVKHFEIFASKALS